MFRLMPDKETGRDARRNAYLLSILPTTSLIVIIPSGISRTMSVLYRLMTLIYYNNV